jgi:two-component system, NarL family, nitrate/nitrite response regulator NarL
MEIQGRRVVNERIRVPLAVRVLRTLVVDDLAPGRGGLAAALAGEPGMEVVGETANVEHAFALAAAITPDVILLAPNLAQVSNSEVVNKLRVAAPDAHIVMLTRAEETQALADGLRAGASGYLVRDLDSGLMADALRCTVEHGGLFGYRARPAASAEAGPAPAATSPLSPREQQILTLVAEGWTNKQIARELGVAESTIKIHIQHILRKLKIESRVQAAVYAAENGFAAKH